jgi:hypothetical protein
LKEIKPFTIGMGDRFAHQGKAQLSVVILARESGIPVYPTWNKSNREHGLIGTRPEDLRAEAEAAVAALGWKEDYYVDADHISLATVDGFVSASNFFTIDVADFTGRGAEPAAQESFVKKHGELLGDLAIAGMAEPVRVKESDLRGAAAKFLLAMQEAGRIYRHIEDKKSGAPFIVEVSVDETDRPQTPLELLLILAMLADEGIPAQTIAPKFTGRFNKGVDYAGDIGQFEKEFEEDLLVVQFAVKRFGLPETLKLSVHSGSDKFSLYPIINRLIKKHRAGLHVKTAGTTWLEEVIGLAEAGGEGLAIAREIYARAHPRLEELVKPYAPVVDIDPGKLPAPEDVGQWTGEKYAATLRHDASNPEYNPHFRQFLHVSFRVAAEMGPRYLQALRDYEAIIARNVTQNLWERHVRPIFG